MQPLSDHELATELRAQRPQPEPEFATELDARVAAGFADEDGRAGAFERLRAWLRPTRRRLLTASAVGAVAAVAVATVVIATGNDGSTPSDPSSSLGFLNLAEEAEAPSEAESGASATDEAIVPGAQSAPSRGTGPYASQTRDREVERSATIFLRTDPGDVRDASADVFGAVHAVDGIVLSSSVEEGEDGGANFEMLVPSGRLGDALASFSEIAEVASREESSADVTARTVGLGERLEDSRATVEGLLAQLAAAETEAERTAAEAELRAERRHVAALRAQLADLRRRTSFARVSLQIVTDDSAGDFGSWGIGAALDDAGRFLEIAAGVALLGLAVLAPFALLALLVWLARRRWLTAGRQRALD